MVEMPGARWTRGNWQGDSWSTMRTFYHSTSPLLLSFPFPDVQQGWTPLLPSSGDTGFQETGWGPGEQWYLGGVVIPSHRTNCPLLCPQAEATYISDLQKQIRVQSTSLFQAGCETDKMKNLTWNLAYKNEVQSNIMKKCDKSQTVQNR